MNLQLSNFALKLQTAATVEHLSNNTENVTTKYTTAMTIYVGRNNAVVLRLAMGLDGPGIESRWETRFSAPVQSGPGAHPASCTLGTGSLSWG
jgi:hypothetical protein